MRNQSRNYNSYIEKQNDTSELRLNNLKKPSQLIKFLEIYITLEINHNTYFNTKNTIPFINVINHDAYNTEVFNFIKEFYEDELKYIVDNAAKYGKDNSFSIRTLKNLMLYAKEQIDEKNTNSNMKLEHIYKNIKLER